MSDRYMSILWCLMKKVHDEVIFVTTTIFYNLIFSGKRKLE